MPVPEIDVAAARALHEGDQALFLDVRDPDAFTAGRIPGALRLDQDNARQLFAHGDKQGKVVVYCYHGNSSKGATQLLLDNGFTDVASMSGGYEAWAAAGAPNDAGAQPAAAEAPDELSVSAEAAAKLREFLAGESEGTAVRLLKEANGSFGLALDDPGASDLRFQVDEVPFAVDRLLAPALVGLAIGWQETPRAGFTLEGGQQPERQGREAMLADIKQRLAEHEVMLFMKGTAEHPMCGFSARTVEALRSLGKPFGHKNVLEQPEYRYVLSEMSSWPTIPQVFVKGEFIGGCDIVLEMQQSGELQKVVEAAFSG